MNNTQTPIVTAPVVLLDVTASLVYIGSNGVDISTIIGNAQRVAVAVITASSPSGTLEAASISAAVAAVGGIVDVRSCAFADGSDEYVGPGGSEPYLALLSNARVRDVRIVP